MDIIEKIYFERQQQFEAATALLKQDLKDMFAGMSVAEIKEIIQYDDTPMLQSLKEIALETEYYEICDAAFQILQERNGC